MIRELDNYLFTKMVINLADSEMEEQVSGDTTKIVYFLKGEEIGVALKKEDRIVKNWQILSKPSFGQVKSKSMYDEWKQEQKISEVVS